MQTVPNVEGLTQDAATTTITAAKLMMGTVNQQTSDTAAAGKNSRTRRPGALAQGSQVTC
jgi:beta-lactam-binding protein with PASTA domain